MSSNTTSIKINLKLPLPKAAEIVPTKTELEDYFLLRLPTEEAQYVRSVLKTKPKKLKKVLQLELDNELKTGKVYVKKKAIEGTMINLPTIIECSKTTNRVNIYKTGTISQMFVCGDSEKLKVDKKTELWPHGLTNPMKNVVRQRFRKTMRNHEDVKEAADVQKEVSLLLRTDYEAVSTRFEVLAVDAKQENETPMEETPYKVAEQMLFGTLSDSDSEDSITSAYDIIDYN